ncbi:MAG: helix-turn-helix transcriptional regulator [Clostridia bacterium]|nr:helix-turn-helix transcriptional regulator [Clostridia bacterium]
MTIGEKIKYFRKRIGITQAKLAELSGIHPVSIRKYEINKMVPQVAQIDRLAEALGVSSFALAGFENNIRLETVGDFMGLMIMLIKTKIVSINGEREESGMTNADTVEFVINPFITNFFGAKVDKTDLSANTILYYLKNENILSDILKWERINHRYEKCAAEICDTSDKELINILEELKEQKEVVELELQHSSILLEQ